MQYTNVPHSIKENEVESWHRFNRIYSLTTELADNDIIILHKHADLHRAWETIADVWCSRVSVLENVDIFYEALFHNCFGKFSTSVSGSNILKLVLLVEDELLKCGYAFNAWKDMSTFLSACRKVVQSVNNDKSLKRVKRWAELAIDCT